MTEKPEPPDDPRAALLEVVDDSEPDELDILAYLRRGLEDGQDLAGCSNQAEQAPCVSRVSIMATENVPFVATENVPLQMRLTWQ